MENKEYNTVEDFVFNKSFREWVLNNDPYSSKFWLSWISYNPEKTSLVNYSRAIIDSLPSNKRAASEKEINDLIEKIISDTGSQPVVLSGDLITPRPKKRVLTISSKNWLNIVAVFILVVASTWYLVTAHRHPDPYKSFASGYTHSLVERVNNSDTLQAISLPDGSRAYLESKSKLSYTDEAAADKREVYLAGSAAFDIRKDLAKPFYVFTRHTILKTNAAGFDVNMISDKKTVLTIKSGNALVFKRRDIDDGGAVLYKVAGVLVTPNQQLTFNEESNLLYKTLVVNPVAVYQPPQPFAFTGEPAAKIFAALQDCYGIPILFDQRNLLFCQLSVDISNQPFFTQLASVCTLLHAKYEVVDGNVLVVAGGCK